MRSKNPIDINATLMTTEVVIPGIRAPSGLQVCQVGSPSPTA